MKSYTKIQKRKDKKWLYFFILFTFIVFLPAIHSIIGGNYLAVVNGYDTFGNICGVRHNKKYEQVSLSGLDTSSKPYVLYFDVKDVANVMRICVNECPNHVYYEIPELVANWMLNDFKYCRYDLDMKHLMKFFSYKRFKSNIGPCPHGDLRQSYVIKQRCIPMDGPPKVEETYSVLNSIFSTISLIFVNVYLTSLSIVALELMAILFSSTFVILIWWQPKISLWIICVSVLLANGGFCALLWYTYENVPDLMDRNPFIYNLLEEFKTNNRVLYFTTVLSSTITILLTIALAFASTHISETVILFNDAFIFLKPSKEIVIIPLITLFAFIGFIYIWTYSMMCMATASVPTIYPYTTKIRDDHSRQMFDEQYRISEKVEFVERPIRRYWFVYFLTFFWPTEFIFACEEFCLDVAVGFWYFENMNFNTKNVSKLLFRFHLGTVAKGSFIFPLTIAPRMLMTTICKILSFILHFIKLEAIEKLSQNFESFRNKIVHFNHCLYAVAAIERSDLCSARKETKLLMLPQIETMNRMSRFILFLAKLTVANLIGLIGMVLLRRNPDIYFYMAPVLFSMILAFYIAHVVLSLIEKVVDTIVFCAAKERHQGNHFGGRLEQDKMSEVFKPPVRAWSTVVEQLNN